ncbi:MAG: hypothetical protein PSX37_08210 [bacterium]|nr:hypothetical protein [bacterium]
MRRIVLASAAVVLMVIATGCSSSGDAESASASPSPSPSASDSGADAVAWAGDVCTQMDRVKTSVSALGSNLSYDITADRSALEQIQRQLTIQVLALGDAASALQTSLTKVPVDFVAANDMVVALQKTGTDTKDAAGQVTEHLKAATEAGNVLSAAAEVGQALVAAKAAFEAGQAFVSEIGSATSTANTELRAAFDAAPQCASL